MAIRQLEIRGYRSLKDAVWRPGSLNLVVGPNGSGKSNLLQLLELISKTARGELAKTINDAGGMVPLLWDHQPGAIGWKLYLTGLNEKDSQNREIYEVCLRQIGPSSAYRIEHDSYINWDDSGREFDKGQNKNTGFRRDRRDRVLVREAEGEEIKEIRIKDDDANESFLSNSAARFWAARWHDGLFWAIHRENPVGTSSPIRRPTTTQHVTKLEAGGGNLVPVLHTLYTGNKDFKLAIDDGMRAGFGEEYERLEFQPAAAQQIQLAVQWKSSTEPHAGQDLSDGTLRFLFLLTVLAHPEPPPLVVIEEPEVGLHPTMFAVVAEYARDAAERTQVVMTSHSPDFLNAFTEMSPTMTLCNWSEGQTHLYTLDGQRLQAWLDRYRLGHLFTSGELDALALPDVEPPDDQNSLADLPPEDAALSGSAGDTAGGADG